MKRAVRLYDEIGSEYSAQRRADPRILSHIGRALTGVESVLNVGAGTGSYEPGSLLGVAVEPSAEMIRQRSVKSNVVQAIAEALPFPSASFDASLAVLTIHHWIDVERGLRECVRVSRRRVAILTWDPDSPGFWLTQEYFPEVLELDRGIFPSLDRLQRCLGRIVVEPVPVPADCIDGFLGAYWQRPEAYLEEPVRSGMSSFARIRTPAARWKQLREDLRTGVWQQTHGDLLLRESLDLGYRLVTARIG